MAWICTVPLRSEWLMMRTKPCSVRLEADMTSGTVCSDRADCADTD